MISKRIGRPLRTAEEAERGFWERVRKTDGCWEWTRQVNSQGYGRFHLPRVEKGRDKRVLCHRYSWALSNGPIPAGMIVLHSCDNPKCVRPDHLSLGTHKMNSQDCVRKGRHQATTNRECYLRGEVLASKMRGRKRFIRNGPRLTIEQVAEIKSSGESAKGLAAQYGVTDFTIFKIRKGTIWKEVDPVHLTTP